MADGVSIESLEMFGEPTGTVDPTEGPLDDPALRQDEQALDFFIALLHHMETYAAGREGGAPGFITGVAAIDEGQLEPGRALADRAQQAGRASRS